MFLRGAANLQANVAVVEAPWPTEAWQTLLGARQFAGGALIGTVANGIALGLLLLLLVFLLGLATENDLSAGLAFVVIGGAMNL